MPKSLKLLLKNLVEEFRSRQTELLKYQRPNGSFKAGYHAGRGQTRKSGHHNVESGLVLDFSILYQTFSYLLNDFLSARDIFDYLKETNTWHEPLNTFEESQCITPSVIGRVCGGFLCRNFELNDYKIIITDESFEIAYKELTKFFKKDVVIYYRCIHLIGIVDDINDLKLSKDAIIKRADYNFASEFSVHYSGNLNHLHVEMFEGDYYLELKYTIPKIGYSHKDGKIRWEREKFLSRKYQILPALALPCILRYGNEIIYSKDWPFVFKSAPIRGKFNGYWFNDIQKISNFSYNHIKLISKTLDTITDFNLLDKKIQLSFERLANAKAAKNINDRIVELALAYEYLVNTNSEQVTLQLRLKIIRLIDDEKKSESIYKTLTDFYKLRSLIVHGNDKAENNEKNLNILSDTESIIQVALLRLIQLNKFYTYKEINEALSKSLYLKANLRALLKAKKA